MNTMSEVRKQPDGTIAPTTLEPPSGSCSAAHRPRGDFRLVHISDPHLSRQFYPEHLKSFKLLLKSILASGCDHLVITGDIVSTANETDYTLAREILGTLGFLESSRLTVVPGNHDIFGGPHRAVDILSFPQYIRSVDYQRNLERFRLTFSETFDGVKFLAEDSAFPFLKNVGPYALIGLNSIPPWSIRKNPLGTNGALDEQQRSLFSDATLKSELGNRTPLVAMHHHFNDLQDQSIGGSFWKRVESNTMRMRGRKRALRMFQSAGVKYILHGHIHCNDIWQHGSITLLNGAGAVCDDPHRFLKYNEILIEANQERVRTVTLPIPYQVPSYALPLRHLRYPVNLRSLPASAKLTNA